MFSSSPTPALRTVSSIVDEVLADTRKDYPDNYRDLDERTKRIVDDKARRENVTPESYWETVLAQLAEDRAKRAEDDKAAEIAAAARQSY
ncbi:hypothetical protein [Arthrobacter sp. NPDC089319]|uniref:hypothetical protein n=1 Tax=Arthrobacter sp. NPDC089319 TaxID=3155915 RepID=UPI00343FE3E3